MALSDNEHYDLEAYVRAVLTRVQSGSCGVNEGVRDLMHVLNAWDQGNMQEFASRMRLRQEQWGPAND